MRKALLTTIAATVLVTVSAITPALAQSLGRHEVYGVKGDDMLKMRAGPGVGYVVIVGLPNGAVVRVISCEQSGATRWCSVTLDKARGLKGYVSASYLRKL